VGNAWWTRWQLFEEIFFSFFLWEDKTGVKLSTLFFIALLFFGVTLQVSVCAKTNSIIHKQTAIWVTMRVGQLLRKHLLINPVIDYFNNQVDNLLG
jgi:hypothetical protein